MSVFREKTGRRFRNDWGDWHDEKKLTKIGKVSTGLSIVVFGFATFSEKGIDILGDADHPVPKAEAIEKTTARYDRTFKNASPAGKFVLQYLRKTDIATRYAVSGSGIQGSWDTETSYKYVSTFNNGCLQRSAYDIAGGTIKGSLSGIFSSGHVSGDVPTAAAYAEINPENHDQLDIKSGHTNSVDLHFGGLSEGEQLVPLDEQTKNILETYGCETGLMRTSKVYDGVSSDYVVK